MPTIDAPPDYVPQPDPTGLYCTVAQARAAGANGTDPQVQAAIAAADTRIDRFCGDTFTSTSTTVRCRVSSATGLAILPLRVQQVDAVAVPLVTGGTQAIASSAYRVHSSAMIGDYDGIEFGGLGAFDPLVVGAEPWNGGYRGLLDRLSALGGGDQLFVTGTFGWAVTPPEVVQAAALIAAAITGTGQLPGTGGSLTADAEGNAVTIAQTTPASAAGVSARVAVEAMVLGTQLRSTGLPAADGLLDSAGLRRHAIRFGG